MLVSLAEQKVYMDKEGSDKDEILNVLLANMNDAVLTFLGRDIESTEYKELYSGSGDYELFLDNFPIISVEVLSQDISKDDKTYGDEIDSDDQLLNKEAGFIELFNDTFTASRRNIYIEYTAGYATVPNDLKEVVEYLVYKRFLDVDNQRVGMTAKNIQGENVSFVFQDLTKVHRDIINKYRKKAKENYGVAVTGWAEE